MYLALFATGRCFAPPRAVVADASDHIDALRVAQLARGSTRVQPHDLSGMRAALNLVSVEPPPEATVNPDNIGIDLDGSSSELRSATVDAEPERVSTSPALVPRSPRLRSSRGENMERRPFPLSKKAGED